MERISTADSYAAVIANMQQAQTQLSTASSQISSGETATDLQGYAAQAETLTAMQTVSNQVTGFLNQQNHARGRPVGVALDKAGALLIADDVGNTVWRVTADSH